MKENIKKNNYLYLILIVLLLNLSCKSRLTAQNLEREKLYSYFDKLSSNKNKFKYLEINLDIDCNNKLLFAVSKKDYLLDYNIEYKAYRYNDVLILFVFDDNIINKKNKFFFDKYLKSINFDINTLEKGNQSLINSYALYFENNKLITDDAKIHHFMKNNCKNFK